MSITDARGELFEPFEPPVRVMSLVPSITELLLDLGLSTREVIGRTDFCIHPRGVIDRIPAVGGTKSLSVDSVLALEPQLVIAGREENLREAVEELERRGNGLRVFVTDPTDFESAITMIREIGTLVGRGVQAAALADHIVSLSLRVDPPTRRSAIYLIWMNPFMTVAPGTFIDDMLKLAGYVNAIWPSWLHGREYKSPEAARYPEIKAADMAALKPRNILLSSEPYPFREDHVEQLRWELAVHDEEFAEEVEIELVNGEYFSWYGSRMELALETFLRKFLETP